MKDGKGGSIMCSYNAVNGVPSCANDLFNNKVVRDEWGFEGYIVRKDFYNSIIIIVQYRSVTVEQ